MTCMNNLVCQSNGLCAPAGYEGGTAPVDSGPVVTPTQAAIVSTQGQMFAGAALFTYSDPFGSAATAYDVWNNGTAGGQFLLNGTPLPVNQDDVITAAQLSQLTYQVGAGTDTLWIKADDGTVWGGWSHSFTISDPSTIGAGETLELSSAYAGTIAFAAATSLAMSLGSCVLRAEETGRAFMPASV